MSERVKEILVTELDTWKDAMGHNLQLCVVHELDDSNQSFQASVTFLGFSLCNEHLHEAKALLLKHQSRYSFTDCVSILTQEIMSGVLE